MKANDAFLQAVAVSKRFTKESLLGGGALVGKNVAISKIEPIPSGNRVIFSYTLDDGQARTSSLDVMDGKDGEPGFDGKGILSVSKISAEGLADTYRISFTDGTHYDYEVKNGAQGVSGKDGKDGITYTPRIGTVTTVPYGASASAQVSVDEETAEAVFDFEIPSGKDGDVPIEVDSELSGTSENPVQNKAVTGALKSKGDTLFYDEELSELQLRSGNAILSTAGIKGGSGGGFRLGAPTEVSLTNADEAVIIKWADPPNLMLDGAALAEWAGTLVVRKAGSAPQSKTDGVVVVDSKTRDAYKAAGFEDNNLTNGVEYFYGIFPYTTDGVYTYGTTQSIAPAEIYPGEPTNVSVRAGNAVINVSFVLPTDAVSAKISYSTQSPESVAEPYGTVISDVSSPYMITGVENDTTYYATVYAVNAKGRATGGSMFAVTPKAAVLFGFVIDQNESDPDSMITYIEDNANFTPAHMDYENDVFDYGSWKDAWFIQDLKPCMLNYDGTVAYELNPNDYTKKKDGTPSDVANADFPGNAMVGIPKVYWKIADNGDDTANVYICNRKLDEDFVCWSHIDINGNEILYCYISCYDASIVNNVARSLSGRNPITDLTNSQEIIYAKANNSAGNDIWNIYIYSDYALLKILLFLIGRSTNTQKVFGTGRREHGEGGNPLMKSGTLDKKGLFYGKNDISSHVKVLGIENLYYGLAKSCAGLVCDHGTQKVKMTHGMSDGTAVDGYNIEGNGYITIQNATPVGTNIGYISKCKFTPFGIIAYAAYGSASTYYCDIMSFDNNKNCVGSPCGASGGANSAGISTMSLGRHETLTSWAYSITLSCKPLAPTGGSES